MRIPIVNEQDEIIDIRERSELSRDSIYRVSALWVTDEDGNILLAQRAFTKSHDPGKWGAAVAGTVEEGETYESNIIKETEEEIGLKNIQPILGAKNRHRGEWNYFTQEFLLTLPVGFNDFTIPKDEVAAVKWFSVEELKKRVAEHPEEFLSGVNRRLQNL